MLILAYFYSSNILNSGFEFQIFIFYLYNRVFLRCGAFIQTSTFGCGSTIYLSSLCVQTLKMSDSKHSHLCLLMDVSNSLWYLLIIFWWKPKQIKHAKPQICFCSSSCLCTIMCNNMITISLNITATLSCLVYSKRAEALHTAVCAVC